MNQTAPPITAILEAHDARYLVDAVLPAVSKDDLTPLIVGAHWKITPGQVEVIATDRYRVHRARLDADTDGEGGFTVPRTALLWLWRNAGFFGRRRPATNPPSAILTFNPGKNTTDPGSVRIAVHEDTSDTEIAISSPLTKGNYPPVWDLIERAKASEHADPASMGRVRLDWLGQAHHLEYLSPEYPTLKHTKGAEGRKPGPLLAIYEHGEVLVQPRTSDLGAH